YLTSMSLRTIVARSPDVVNDLEDFGWGALRGVEAIRAAAVSLRSYMMRGSTESWRRDRTSAARSTRSASSQSERDPANGTPPAVRLCHKSSTARQRPPRRPTTAGRPLLPTGGHGNGRRAARSGPRLRSRLIERDQSHPGEKAQDRPDRVEEARAGRSRVGMVGGVVSVAQQRDGQPGQVVSRE